MLENTQLPEKEYNRRYLTPKEIFAYCVTDMGNVTLDSFISQQKQTYLMNYAGLTGTQYGIVTGISTAWDALDDPLSGVIIDRMRTRWGRLRPFLILPIPLWSITTILLFMMPSGFSTSKAFVYALVNIIINGIGVSYWSGWKLLLYNITPSMDERSKLIATQKFVELFDYLPSLVPVFLDLIPKLTNNRIVQTQIYGGFSIFFTSVAVITSIYGFFNLKERIPQASKEEMSEVSILKSFKLVLNNRPFISLLLSDLTGCIYNIRTSAGEDFFWLNCMGSYSYRFTASLFTGLPNYIIMPLAPAVIKKVGLKRATVTGGLFQGITRTLFYIIGYSPFKTKGANFAYMTAALTFTQLPNKIISVCEPMLIGEVYDYMEWKNGIRNEGIVNAVSTYAKKLSGTLTGLLSGVIYDIIKFKPMHDEFGNVIPHTDPKVLKGIYFIFMMIPGISKYLYSLSLCLYNITGETKEKMNKELEERRKDKLKIKT